MLQQAGLGIIAGIYSIVSQCILSFKRNKQMTTAKSQ